MAVVDSWSLPDRTQILAERECIKRQTIEHLRLQNRKIDAYISTQDEVNSPIKSRPECLEYSDDLRSIL